MYAMIRKILKALNSSQYSWQLSLAAVLGMMPGLTPAFALHNLLFFLLAFLINVNLGLFFISMGVFAAVGYLADPLMESLGYWLLTLPALEGLWTAFYNNPWLLLSGFNNSLTLGSLTAGLLLAVPLYFALEMIVKTYRGPISRFTGRLPVVRGFLAFDEKEAAQTKKPAKVRWWGLGLFIVLTVPVAVFAIFFMDAMIKSQLESALSKPVGMQVTIDKLHTTLSPLSMTIEGLQIPDAKDAMKNSVEVARIAFDLDLARLFHKKVLIDEMTVTGVKLETARKTPAKKLPKTQEPPAPKEPEEPGMVGRFAMDMADKLPEPKTVVANEPLKSKTESERIQKRLDEIKAYWDEAIKTKFDKKALSDLEAEYKTLENRAGKIKNEKDLKSVLEDAKAFQKKLSDRQKAYKALIEQFNADNKEAKALLAELKKLPGADYEALRKKYSFDTEGAFNVAEALLGSDVTDNIKLAQEWYGRLSPYLKTAKEIKGAVKGEPLPKPVRGEGRIVRFTEYRPTPVWHIKKAGFDVTTPKGSQLLAMLEGATDNQKITGKPMTLAVKSLQAKGYDALSLVWINERRGATGEDKIEFAWQGVERAGVKADKLFMAPSKADWMLAMVIKEGRLNGDGLLSFSNTALGVENPKGELEKLVARTLEGIKDFEVKMALSGKPLSPRIDFKTDLDNQIKNRFAAELEKRKKEFEAQLKAEIEKAVQAELKKAGASEAEIAALEKAISGEGSVLGVLEARAGKSLSEKALKEALQKKLDAEKKKQEAELKKKLEQEAKKLLPKL